MTIPLNVLIVEDSANDAELLAIELQKAGFDLKWKRVETESGFRAGLNAECNMVFSDSSLTQFSAMRAFDLLQESKLDIPFIIVSGTIGEERAVESMNAGVTDYVPKDRLNRLGLVVKRALREIQERAGRKQAEAQFIEAQKMEVLGHLAGGVAHDFNNILSVIIGYSDLMMPKLGDEGLPYNCAREIRQAAECATALTRQILLFSRKQTLQSVVLDLNQIVKNMDEMLRRLIDENIELTVVFGKHAGRIKADPGQVVQVLMNLVVNARDAMPSGGILKIETANVTLGEDFVCTYADAKPGEYVLLTVSDSGVGMTDEVKASLFKAFFTTKPKGKGTGLGLTTCQTIVKHCGGCIEVQSELGKGTIFKIYFPQVEQPADASTKLIKGSPVLRETETLLLV